MRNAPAWGRRLLSATLALCVAGASAPARGDETTPNAPTEETPETPDENPDPEPEPQTGDPVGYVSGSVYDSATDVRVVCPDLDLVFRRAYGSWSTRSGTLGHGWSHAYEWSLEKSEDGSIRVYADSDPEVAGCGKVHRFAPPDTGGRSYDAAGYSLARTSGEGHLFVSPAGTVHAFNSAGRLASTTSWNGTRVLLERETADGPVVRAVHDCGAALGFEYDGGGRLVRVTTPAPAAWIELVYTKAALVPFPVRGCDGVPAVATPHSCLAAVVRMGDAVFDRAFAYDGLDRLAADGPVSYSYDAAGNRLSARGGAEGDVAYEYSPGDRLSSWTCGSCAWDAAGCATRIAHAGRPVLGLVWDGRCWLVSVSTNGVPAESYAYDALGRRVSTVTAEGTVRHVYDDRWQCLADLAGDGTVLRAYLWGEGVDRLLAVRAGGREYAALTDGQGTVWGFSDGTDVVAHWTYDAWGNVLSEDVSPSASALAGTRHRFHGRELSAATGLVHFRARWYDPAVGWWISKDPIRLHGGLNLYAFCADDSVNKSDSYGLWAFAIGGGGSVGAVSGVSLSSGIVISHSKKCGWSFGTYQTAGVGSHIGASASFGTSLTILPGANSIHDMSGASMVQGGSGRFLLGGGAEASVPVDGNANGIGVTVSGGVGIGGEGHVSLTYTTIQEF